MCQDIEQGIDFHVTMIISELKSFGEYDVSTKEIERAR